MWNKSNKMNGKRNKSNKMYGKRKNLWNKLNRMYGKRKNLYNKSIKLMKKLYKRPKVILLRMNKFNKLYKKRYHKIINLTFKSLFLSLKNNKKSKEKKCLRCLAKRKKISLMIKITIRKSTTFKFRKLKSNNKWIIFN